MKFSLPNGTTGFTDDTGKWVCTGSQMGRSNILPTDRLTASPKLHLIRLPFVDQCYDRWGAYWGGPANVWCAYGKLMAVDCGCCGSYHREGYTGDCRDGKARLDTWQDEAFRVFVRADSRDEAKCKVRESIPNARFYH